MTPKGAVRPALASIEQYFLSEESSPTRHEYTAGILHDMAGASARHNLIAGNLFAAFHHHLSATPFEVFMADMKVRIGLGTEEIFYYPDVMVCCDAADRATQYRGFPKIICEVMSPSTERVDRGEKFLMYRTIPSLEDCIILEQDQLAVTCFQRQKLWRPETINRRSDVLVISSIELRLELAAIYAKTGL